MSHASLTRTFCLLAASILASVTWADRILLPLTLVPSSSTTNRLDLEVSAFGVSSSDTTDLSGTVNALFVIDLTPQGAEVAGIRFNGGVVDATDLDFDFKVLFVTVASIDGRNLGGSVTTTTGRIRPVTDGSFASEDHTVSLNQGTLDIYGALVTDTTTHLNADPIELTLSGTSTVELFEASAVGNLRTYQATVTLPVDTTHDLTDPAATIHATGAIVATGSFEVELPLAGDFNGDGAVDTADYTLWRDAYAVGAAPASDYDTWVANYGAPSASQSTSVPEPGALVLALLGIVASRPRRG